jgi:hypothetical protein
VERQLEAWQLVAVEAEDWKGQAFHSRVDAGNECKKFETKRRRLDLSFNHHREVAALPPPEPTRFSIGARNRSRRMASQVWGAPGSGRTSGLERSGKPARIIGADATDLASL